MTPLVSIIIPTYNRAHLIGETLQSVLDQTYPHWECIVVDDLSTDNTDEVMHEWTKKDARFQYHKRHREPKGAPTCRNIGLERAEGELVVFFDSDDLMMPYCLERRVRYFAENDSLDVLISYQKRIENGKETFLVNVPTENDILVRFFTIPPCADIPWVNNSATIKKDFLNHNKVGWNESLTKYQDIQFHLDLLNSVPKYRWAEGKFDSCWIFNDTQANIGKDQAGIESDMQLFAILFSAFRYVRLELKPLVLCQINAVTFEYMTRIVEENAIMIPHSFFLFFQKHSKLPKTTIKLIRFRHRLLIRRKRFYIHRFFLRKIGEYLDGRYTPAIKKNSFLRIRELPQVLQ